MDAVLEEYAALAPPVGRLKSVHVVVGRMHQVIPDYLITAYALLTRDTAAANSELELEFRAVLGRCRDCDWQGEITQPFFQCDACGALAIDVMQGRELYLDRLRLESDERRAAPANRSSASVPGNHPPALVKHAH